MHFFLLPFFSINQSINQPPLNRQTDRQTPLDAKPGKSIKKREERRVSHHPNSLYVLRKPKKGKRKKRFRR